MPLLEEENTSSENPKRLNPSSATRFRLQALLITTTVVAGIAALCGAYLRGASEAEQRCLLILWGSGAASFAIWMLGYTWQRHRSEKKVGIVRFRLAWFVCLRTLLFSPKIYGLFFLVTAAFLIITQTGQYEKFAKRGETFWLLAALGFNPGLLFALGLISIWWRKEFWIGEEGIAWLSGFRPWAKINDWYPHKKRADILVLGIQLGGLDRKVAVRVPPELREQVDALIAEKLENRR